ncbi:transposable element Tcb1 transposase [Trichonephila clavipes]|nr:transposable element Tcb1 transposase [Trichonephila clavipes]
MLMDLAILNLGQMNMTAAKFASSNFHTMRTYEKHIAELHKEGKSFREIGKVLKLSFTTVGYIAKKYLVTVTGSVENKPRPGGLSKLTSRAKQGRALEPKTAVPTLKYDDGNVIVWGCVAHNEAGNLPFIGSKMIILAYIDVLWHNLLDSAKKLSMENTFIFQQDNDPKHTAIVTKTWLLYHAPRRLETPPQSPDLNPIENL